MPTCVIRSKRRVLEKERRIDREKVGHVKKLYIVN